MLSEERSKDRIEVTYIGQPSQAFVHLWPIILFLSPLWTGTWTKVCAQIFA